jgi:hypothetical protein
VVEEELKALRIEGGQFQKETLPGKGVDGPIQIQTLEARGRGDNGLDPTGGDPAALDRQQPTATFVLDP